MAIVSLKQLAQYCRDYIDLISPSLLSRQAKQVRIPYEILDATPLYQSDPAFDYDSLSFKLNLELSASESFPDDAVVDPKNQDLSDAGGEKLEIANALDDIYRKYETSSYTKQISLQFGRISFAAKPLICMSDQEIGDKSEFINADQYLFSVPVQIRYHDSGGARHYSLLVEDTIVKTHVDFLKEFLSQEQRDELFEFISLSEASEQTTIPLSQKYVDELWSKIVHLLRKKGAKDIALAPEMDSFLVILLPKVNYFLSQDLLDIIQQSDDESLLDTSLSAWVDEKDMSINELFEDNGEQELFFPFPYDKFQLQVLGKLDNKATVVEGPPGTGKSQTIANILCHLAAMGKKVLFVSQKDQAVRGVKDKLKALDIPYLYGYLPDRSSRLHSEEDERDSAANALKGIAQAIHNPGTVISPSRALTLLHEYKPQFNESIENERKYSQIYSEWLSLDPYDFGGDSPRITNAWFDELNDLHGKIEKAQASALKLQNEQKSLNKRKTKHSDAIQYATDQSITASNEFAAKSQYDWTENEEELLRTLEYGDVSRIMFNLLEIFETNAIDRRNNFIIRKLSNIKLAKVLNSAIEDLPQEIFESLRTIVFSEETKTRRFVRLKEIGDYFCIKAKFEQEIRHHNEEIRDIQELLKTNTVELDKIHDSLRKLSRKLTELQVDAESMDRIYKLVREHGVQTFISIARRQELKNQLSSLKILNPNLVNEEIIREKAKYKSLIRDYLKNRLSSNVEEFKKVKQNRASLITIGRKLSKSKKAYRTFDALKSNPDNFEAMSGVIPIWMMGLDDASRVLPLKANIFDYVIIDEASQCNISYTLPTMYRGKHTILFGDTLQMRDSTTSFKSNASLEALAHKHKIPGDLQIKAIDDAVQSVMDIAMNVGFLTTYLRNHYRSPKELIGFSNEYFYEPKGRKLQVMNDDIVATDEGRVLTNHVLENDPSVEISEKTNLTEAIYIRDVLLPKIKNNQNTTNKSIAILTFFNEQAELLRKVITDDTIKISVIEGIQGDERDIVIYSFVIKSPQEKSRYVALTGENGEVRKEVNEGRINVAFSRARLQVHTVTSIPPNIWPEGIWIKRYLEYVEERGRVDRLSRSEQHFDSVFEKNVYDFLFSSLSSSDYRLTTQVESCGFKIDLVIHCIKTGRKLAIECDGPTHFERGDGQVRVASDYERQLVLETAGWRFYRITYSEWIEQEQKQKEELINYIEMYMIQSEIKAQEDNVSYDPVYVPINVNVPAEFVTALKANIPEKTSQRFGNRKSLKSVKKSILKAAPLFEQTQSGSIQQNKGHDKTTNSKEMNRPRFTVGDRGVNQLELETYLNKHANGKIQLRYQSMRAGSARYWRELTLVDFDKTHIRAKEHGKDFIATYRRDRVIEYR